MRKSGCLKNKKLIIDKKIILYDLLFCRLELIYN